MHEATNRLRFLSIVVFLFALVLIGKLYFVQIVKNQIYVQKAEHQYVAGANYFNRGSIFFSAKDGSEVPAASVKTGFILALNPQLIFKNGTNLDLIYSKVDAIVPMAKIDFLVHANKTTDPYEVLADRVSTENANAIQALNIGGVSVYEQKWRVYPGLSMSAQTVGLIGYSGNDLAGRYGLERYYEPVLARSGDDAFVNFFAEIFSDIKKTVTPGQSIEGDIVTTIEPSVEQFLEHDLQKIQDQYHSEFTGGIVIDPKTGEIYAMALNPTFDPNNTQGQKDPSVFRNKFVEDRYEMGSIIKAITMSIGLDSGAVTPDTTFNDPGCITLNKKKFCNYDNKSHGSNLKMQIILDKSLNTGATFVQQQVGNRKFGDYMLRFGMGSTTGIDLPNEGNSLVSNLTKGDDLEYAQASFGQGIALTPIQTVRALSVLANGGTLINPHLVKEIDYSIGTKKVVSTDPGPRIISQTSSEEISRMLTEVVDTALKNGQVRLTNYSVAAKTGTAQLANPNGGYYADHYLHSFFGYFPAYNPRFLIFLYTYYPKNVLYASETLTDTFIDMTKFLINYYNIPPDRDSVPPPTVHM
jgi:cell division protein FtsI/penicillin-binding protein 2